MDRRNPNLHGERDWQSRVVPAQKRMAKDRKENQ